MDNFDFLIELLNTNVDNIRYSAFLQAVDISKNSDSLYNQYFKTFYEKLKSNNYYQRTIGLTLIAENAKWDSAGLINGIIDDYLNLLNDKKPITVRQCIQNLEKIVASKKELKDKITDKLLQFNLLTIRESMRKLLLIDILNVLIFINNLYGATQNTADYIKKAFSGDLLDKKTVKELSAKINKEK